MFFLIFAIVVTAEFII